MNTVTLDGQVIYINTFTAKGKDVTQFNLLVNKSVINCIYWGVFEIELYEDVVVTGELNSHKRNTEIKIKEIYKVKK
jgi:hypothetical protein